ncbi:MFS transporter [Streptomyces sp. NBC_00102]|uniref:MFS transporter n=1 Tax=Streptomyces sp. NBC_00102 TaxID=2975652 RepID=UPI00225BF66B|nr:MFS transporter [Streptomyces sp. NBC_00102]MCX5397748.1 MFS transporter [Streptomyces sp. NBC_00102]
MTEGKSSRVRSAKRVATAAVAVLFMTWLIDYIDRLVITLALPDIGEEFGLGTTMQGLILTAFFITYAAMQIPGGILADTKGARRAMLIAAGGWTVFTAASGIAIGLTTMIVIRAVFGIFQGMYPAASMKALSERTTPAQRLTANGIMSASNPLGSAIAPIVAAPLIVAFGWRGAFWSVSVLGLLIVIVLWKGMPKPLTTEELAAATGQATTPQPVAQVSLRQAMGLLKSSMMWRFALMMCGFNIIGWGLVSWVPSYLRENKDVSLTGVGLLSGVPWVAAAISMMIGGYLFDRFLKGNHRRVVIPVMVVLGGLLVMMVRAGSAGEFIAWETCATLVMYLAYMQIFGLPLRMLPPEYAGVGGGMVNFGGQLAGAISPFVMGFLAEHFSYGVAFSFLGTGCVLAIVGALVTPQTPEAFRAGLGRHLDLSESAPKAAPEPVAVSAA